MLNMIWAVVEIGNPPKPIVKLKMEIVSSDNAHAKIARMKRKEKCIFIGIPRIFPIFKLVCILASKKKLL